MSIEAFERREAMLGLRDRVLINDELKKRLLNKNGLTPNKNYFKKQVKRFDRGY